MEKIKTAILVSGGGMNLQAIIDAHVFGEIPNCELTAVISSAPDVYALTRAKGANIPCYVVEYNLFPNIQTFNTAMMQKLEDLDIELVVLAGYIYPISTAIKKAYENKIINTHPTLLPAFENTNGATAEPYESAIRTGVKLSGATAYFVNESNAPIILQQAVEVWEGDTPMTLQRRIMEEAEWKILPKAMALYCQKRLNIENGIVHIIRENQ